MIKPTCDKCKNELDDFGGIILSPPNENNQVSKYHICKDCYNRIIKKINNDL